ncbi:MAG: hypothetical protein GY757_14635, partial [bacterium]|nr:hypothetical protein [bacterium]
TQVKIRGYRIELGEIENRLKGHGEIKEAVVLNRETGGDTYLCAYIVTDRTVTGEELEEYLSQSLPDYMIPAQYITMDKIPLTVNGKVNKKALPLPEIVQKENYTAPRSRVEKKLVEIWGDILALEKKIIGIDDNFFRLNGHSLKATVMSARIHKELKVRVPLAEIFKTPHIRGISKYILSRGEEKYHTIPAVEKKEYYDLSYAQRRLWILCQFEADSIAYNMPIGVEFSGKFETGVFQRALQAVVERHESLRTVFITVDGEPRQKIIPYRKVEL